MTYILLLPLFVPAVVIALILAVFLDITIRLPRVVVLMIAVFIAPVGSILFFYIGAGGLGLMAVLLTPLFLLFGVVGALIGLKVVDVVRDLRGHDQI
ncbi:MULTISPECIES: hypothetical protein [Sphingomonas]|uniref:Uncharacterized protein n=1 Tax=Sphingomonas zeae TaxID=1646122 RepID=A0A7Y6B5U6_9SPHN|nr:MULTISPECIES: hypothetical protein [Sphingomonas]MBB4048601.1 uncharacterized BrkB/YihY/UPF0761 family membrane protein [Sphingomonas zeae]MDK8186505.1 hypothetical protein [Sphingomonas zeae]MDK8216164.1 hypothetical protein [Sphingomonas sp. UMB7805-LC452B]NUU47967.1 hypothetical protein [Sphingomonas zeae]